MGSPVTRTITAIALMGVLVLLGLNLWEGGRESMRAELAQTCPDKKTAYSVRYPDGRIKCVAYQEPMPKSKVEQARAANGRARMAKVEAR